MFFSLVSGLGRCVQLIYPTLVAIKKVSKSRSKVGCRCFKQFVNLWELNSSCVRNMDLTPDVWPSG